MGEMPNGEWRIMTEKTMVERMRSAMRQYRIDQPDSYTVAIYGPNGFYEIHDTFSKAFERKEELAIMAALKAIMIPSRSTIEAGEQAMDHGEARQVWQAFLSAIIHEHEAADHQALARLDDKIKAFAPSP